MARDRLSLQGLSILPEVGGPQIDVGNNFCTFGIGYAVGTSGGADAGIAARPLPDRPKEAWPQVYYDESAGYGTTLGPTDAAISAFFVRRLNELDLDELRRKRRRILAVAQFWGDGRMEAVLDRILEGAPRQQLLDLVDPIQGRAARLDHSASAADWLELAAADPTWNKPLFEAFRLDPRHAEAVLRRHLAFDVGGPCSAARTAARALFKSNERNSALWPVAAAASAGEDMGPAFVEAAGLLAHEDPLCALVLAANAIAVSRDETARWPNGAWELIQRCAHHAHSDYQSWIAKLPS